MQVALNSDKEYSGGRLMYLRDGKIEIPERDVGTITIHENNIVHGVTQLENGIKYGLFFL